MNCWRVNYHAGTAGATTYFTSPADAARSVMQWAALGYRWSVEANVWLPGGRP